MEIFTYWQLAVNVLCLWKRNDDQLCLSTQKLCVCVFAHVQICVCIHTYTYLLDHVWIILMRTQNSLYSFTIKNEARKTQMLSHQYKSNHQAFITHSHVSCTKLSIENTQKGQRNSYSQEALKGGDNMQITVQTRYIHDKLRNTVFLRKSLAQWGDKKDSLQKGRVS